VSDHLGTFYNANNDLRLKTSKEQQQKKTMAQSKFECNRSRTHQ